MLFTFKHILENDDYDIISFSNPEIALKFLQENYYCFNNNLLIILDIRMKDLNGIQLYKQIKSLDFSIKILFITALDIVDED